MPKNMGTGLRKLTLAASVSFSLIVTPGITRSQSDRSALLTPSEVNHPSDRVWVQNSQISASEIEQTVRDFMAAIASGDFDRALSLTHSSYIAETGDDLEQAWNQLRTTTGEFRQIDEIRVTESLENYVAFAEIEFERATDRAIFVFNPEGEIIAIDVPRQEAIEEIAAAFIDNLAAEDYIAARRFLHPAIEVEFSPEILQEKWENLQGIVGVYQGRSDIRVEPNSEVDIVLIELVFENFREDFLIVFDREKRIIGVDYPRD